MAAPVVVQGLPAAPDLRAAVLTACSDALKHRACVAGGEADQGGAAPSATAIIAWPDGGDRHVRVSLERSGATPIPRVNRDTRFADEDPLIERWRSVGLVIAALVGESEQQPDDRAGSDERLSSGQAVREHDHGGGWLGLTALAGPGLDDGSVRLGVGLQGGIGLRESPLFVAASVSYALRPVDQQEIEVRWTTVGLGGGARALVPSVDLGLRVHLDVLLEYLRASSTAGGAVSGGGSRFSPGLRGGAAALWPASGSWGATLGFSLWSLPGGTAIQVDQRKLGSSQWLSYAGFLGAQWSFR